MTGQGKRTERACKWCGGGMEGKRMGAMWCSVKCKSAEYYKANAEILDERNREWRNANPTRLADYQRKASKKNAERISKYQREYRQANAERLSEYQREYYLDNAARKAEYQREYHQANRERILERQREYLNNRIAAASTLSLAHTISQIRGDLTNGAHEPE